MGAPKIRKYEKTGKRAGTLSYGRGPKIRKNGAWGGGRTVSMLFDFYRMVLQNRATVRNESYCNILVIYELICVENRSSKYWKTILKLFSFFLHRPLSHLSFITQNQILPQYRRPPTHSFHALLCLKLSLSLSNFWILWFNWPNLIKVISVVFFFAESIFKFHSLITNIFITSPSFFSLSESMFHA